MQESSGIQTYFKAFALFSNPRWLVLSSSPIVLFALYWVGLLIWTIPDDPRRAKAFEQSPWMIATAILLGVVVAQFFVWKEEHKKGQTATSLNEDTVAAIKRDYDLACSLRDTLRKQLETTELLLANER